MVFPARAMNRVFVCLAVCSTLAGVTSCTIVHHGAGGGAENDSAQKAAANAEFDAKGFVQANWATKVVPELTRDAVDVRAVVAALKADQGAAEKQYGRRKDETALFNFVVKGNEVIKSVNTTSAVGVIELTLSDGADSTVKLQIGPVIRSSAVRDSLSFINFGDFTNQLDFANISKEFNFYVRDHIVADAAKSGAAGKHVSFVGAFAEDGSGQVVITPVQLSIQ